MKAFLAGDKTIILAGAGISLAAGLLLGGAMQPRLYNGDDRPMGPQMFADWAGDGSTGPFDPGTSFVSYRGNPPDYVLGTDWKKAMAWPDERAAVSPPAGDAAQDDAPAQPDEPAVLTRAAYEEPPPAPRAYPSLDGGQASPSAPDADKNDAARAVDPRVDQGVDQGDPAPDA